MDIKSRIEQIISNNIEIGETENRLDYVVHNTSELAEEIMKLLGIPDVVGRSEQFKCEKCDSDWGEVRHTCFECNHEFGDL